MNSAKKYDVVVCGSGSAGFCAAIQSARAGMKTAIIEKHGMPGGSMTIMGNTGIGQFYAHRKQIISGIGWDFVLEIAKRGYTNIPDMTIDMPHYLYNINVNQVAAAALLDELFLEAGIDIYYNQPIVDVNTTKTGELNHLDSVIISTKSGLKTIEATVFIDCSGDGDICLWSGAPFEIGDEKTGELQPSSIRFYINKNKLNDEEITYLNSVITQAKKDGRILAEDLTTNIETVLNDDGSICNHISDFDCSDSDEKTKADIEGRKCVYRLMELFKNANTDLEITSCAPEVAIRETRRIIGDGYITLQDYVNGRHYDDAICYSFYPIDLHLSGDNGIYQEFIAEGVVPEIPLSALIPKNISNVFVAGRCASGDRLANSAYRVKATCMAMGQAAGAAAAVAVSENAGNVRGLNLDKVKDILVKNGAIVPN